MSILIVMVSGLPGAGKSTLVTEFINSESVIPHSSRVSALRCKHVCLDEIMDSEGGTGPWSADSPDKWKRSRDVMMETVRNIVQDWRKVQTDVETEDHLVVFVDDNFQLRSMRKELFVQARERTFRMNCSICAYHLQKGEI